MAPSCDSTISGCCGGTCQRQALVSLFLLLLQWISFQRYWLHGLMNGKCSSAFIYVLYLYFLSSYHWDALFEGQHSFSFYWLFLSLMHLNSKTKIFHKTFERAWLDVILSRNRNDHNKSPRWNDQPLRSGAPDAIQDIYLLHICI